MSFRKYEVGDYDDMVAAHEWDVPERYNIAVDVCDKHDRDRLAMVWEDYNGDQREVSFGELQDLSNKFANVLESHGIEREDRVATLLPSLPETAAVFLGTYKRGAILLSMSVLYGDEGIQHRLRDSEARVLVTNRENRDRIPDGMVEHVWVMEDLVDELEAASADYDVVDTAADDPAQLYYSSGTTGLAKGILHAHRYLLAHEEFEFCHDLKDGERFHGMGEWAWAAGIAPLLGPWRYGAVALVFARKGGFDPKEQLDFLARHGVQNMFTTPTALRAMTAIADAGREYPLPDLRVVCSAGEPLNPEVIRWFRDQYGLTVLDYYGLTESYPLCGNFPTVEVREGSMGKVMPGWDVQILDEDEKPVEQGERGEICLRARSNPHYPLRYWNNEEATKEDFEGDWFHTKDAAQMDEDGYVWYAGRADDVIISAGYRIGPFEVESACVEHPAVLEAAAVASPDQKRGDIVKAFIRLADGYEASDETADEIKQFVRGHLSAYAYPRAIEFVDDLPKTLTGKIRRIELREAEREKARPRRCGQQRLRTRPTRAAGAPGPRRAARSRRRDLGGQRLAVADREEGAVLAVHHQVSPYDWKLRGDNASSARAEPGARKGAHAARATSWRASAASSPWVPVEQELRLPDHRGRAHAGGAVRGPLAAARLPLHVRAGGRGRVCGLLVPVRPPGRPGAARERARHHAQGGLAREAGRPPGLPPADGLGVRLGVLEGHVVQPRRRARPPTRASSPASASSCSRTAWCTTPTPAGTAAARSSTAPTT